MTTKARKIADIIGNISNDKLQSADLDVSFENISDTGTEGTKVASGTTAQRGTTTGQWRFNTTTGYFEGRNASGSFSTLEPTPTVSSVDDGEVDSSSLMFGVIDTPSDPEIQGSSMVLLTGALGSIIIILIAAYLLMFMRQDRVPVVRPWDFESQKELESEATSSRTESESN